MVAGSGQKYQAPLHPLHPLHAPLLAGTVPLFLGALFCDIAYSRSYQAQ